MASAFLASIPSIPKGRPLDTTSVSIITQTRAQRHTRVGLPASSARGARNRSRQDRLSTVGSCHVWILDQPATPQHVTTHHVTFTQPDPTGSDHDLHPLLIPSYSSSICTSFAIDCDACRTVSQPFINFGYLCFDLVLNITVNV